MGQESQKVQETKDRIRNAFFEIYSSKKIEKISIKEITEKAQLNRGTFYVYYKDIYDLLEKTEEELMSELLEKVRSAVVMILRDESVSPFMPPIEFYQKYNKILRTLLGANGDPNFVFKMKKVVKGMLREVLKKEKMPEIEHIEYLMEYISSAQIGIISYWLENDMEIPIVELGEMIKQITLHGPLGFLRGQSVVKQDPAQ